VCQITWKKETPKNATGYVYTYSHKNTREHNTPPGPVAHRPTPIQQRRGAMPCTFSNTLWTNLYYSATILTTEVGARLDDLRGEPPRDAGAEGVGLEAAAPDNDDAVASAALTASRSASFCAVSVTHWFARL